MQYYWCLIHPDCVIDSLGLLYMNFLLPGFGPTSPGLSLVLCLSRTGGMNVWTQTLVSPPQNRAREFLQCWSSLWWPARRRERRGAHSKKVERLCLSLSEQDLEEILPESLQLCVKSIGKQSKLMYRFPDYVYSSGLNAWHWKQLAKGGPCLYYWTLTL